MIPIHLRGVKGDDCQCGRRFTIRHCPKCGSTRTYCYSQEQTIERAGVLVKVRLFRCVPCGHRYTDEDREFCDAPPINVALANQKIQALAEANRENEPMNEKDKNIVAALKIVAPEQFVSQEFTDSQLKMLWTQLRSRWVVEKLKSPIEKFPSLVDYLRSSLKDMNVPSERIEVVMQWHNELISFVAAQQEGT